MRGERGKSARAGQYTDAGEQTRRRTLLPLFVRAGPFHLLSFRVAVFRRGNARLLPGPGHIWPGRGTVPGQPPVLRVVDLRGTGKDLRRRGSRRAASDTSSIGIDPGANRTRIAPRARAGNTEAAFRRDGAGRGAGEASQVDRPGPETARCPRPRAPGRGTEDRKPVAGAFDLPTGNSRSPPGALRWPQLAHTLPVRPLYFLHRMGRASRRDLRPTSPRIGQGHIPTFLHTYSWFCFA